MEMKWLKSVWGMGGSMEEQFAAIAEAGYDGIESPLPLEKDEQLFRSLLEAYNFKYAAMIFTGDDHLATFRYGLEAAARFDPLVIVAHSAKDAMPYEEQLHFYKEAVRMERYYGISVGHETHRGRAMFTPWVTSKLLQEVEDLRITADFSHWCCVCESLLEHHHQAVQLACQRTIHIHGRVGHAQGPQVPDPSAPEYANELQVHLGWWMEILSERRSEGASIMTFTPEFGPSPYMPTIPHTKQPVADLFHICRWTKDHVRQVWNQLSERV
ncbi:sugar phosphate isomerase/epimerase family protein [Paenibacillus roseipurpureus]|uniref:Sugar phosphate isomerase/epimerase n=1 Tax=Paenibacillus roseopurpureus TaxID=2918901 RepID=A0AA96LS55_9BACL|nr:sugar phosphate isomerase/epimerase [Paenibacillus sp. MBLB1832]WNR46259.1 sugar phosphate isomerase/epimerase [Paenibacillus sp. MBLB1832]